MKLAVNVPSGNDGFYSKDLSYLSMNFVSILFNNPTDQANALQAGIPPFFVDLNLDQVIDAVTAEWEEYDLKPFFYSRLNSIDAVHYRHEVFRDLENEGMYDHVRTFAGKMREVRRHLKLVEKRYYQRQKETWFLYAAGIYCEAVKRLAADLASASPSSRGFKDLNKFLAGYVSSSPFTSTDDEVTRLKTKLEKVKYQIIIRGNAVTVQNYEPGTDYSEEIEKVFEKFKHGAGKDYRAEFKSEPEYMNDVEARILNFVAMLNERLFSDLEAFCIRNKNFMDETIVTFDREIHFYIAYLEHLSELKSNDLKFCYPTLVSETKEVYNDEGFDLALAKKLADERESVVCNDFYLKDKERIIVITGPNQGGKTTFARTFGQLHYLAALGCPVPGSRSQLFFFDHLFAQFERPEKVENQRGKLEDDLTRIHSIFTHATGNSIIIMNEIFNSTTLQDAKFLSAKILDKILKLDALCVWVTFVDELSTYSEQTVSMISTIVPDNPSLRTFKIIRRPADGLAYALAIAEKYNLTYKSIKEHIGP